MRRNQAVALFKNYALYWIGIAMAIACLVLAFSGNAAFAGRFTPVNIPASWLAGIGSIIAFAAYEYCDPTAEDQPETELSAEEFLEAQDYLG